MMMVGWGYISTSNIHLYIIAVLLFYDIWYMIYDIWYMIDDDDDDDNDEDDDEDNVLRFWFCISNLIGITMKTIKSSFFGLSQMLMKPFLICPEW